MEVCLGRSIMGVILMYALLKYEHITVYQKDDPNFKYMMLRGLAGLFYFASMTYSVGHVAVSTVFLSQNLSPMISSIGSYFLFKEGLSKIDIMSLFIGFGGVLLILSPHPEGVENHTEMSTLQLILILTLPFQLSTLQLFIRYM
jgi:drug/metabolite transporter (DMT)-like permease